MPKKAADPKGKKTIERVMTEFKEGDLNSSSGDKVKNPKQAIAIALSEARKAGADIPDNRPASKKAVAKKVASKKAVGKKAASKKASAKKSA